MNDKQSLISSAFKAFIGEAPQHAQAWNGAVQGLASAGALDGKTRALAYLAVLAAMRLESGVPFHVQAAREGGASREEVISAVLLGLPVAGLGVTQVLPAAISRHTMPVDGPGEHHRLEGDSDVLESGAGPGHI